MSHNMHTSYVYHSLIRTPVMDSMPAKWLVGNILSWIFFTAILVVQLHLYFVVFGVAGFMVTRYFLQKAYAKDDIIIGVYCHYFCKNDFYSHAAHFTRKLENFKS